MRDWRFSSVRSGSRPSNDGASMSRNGRDGAGSMAMVRWSMPRLPASFSASAERVVARVARRHEHAVCTCSAPRASAAMHATSDESMPPDRPMTTSVKPFLRDVVAGAEHERLVHLGDRRRARASTTGRGVGGRRSTGSLGDDDVDGSGSVGDAGPAGRAGACGRPAAPRGRRRATSSANCGARASSSPSASNTIEAPSKTSSSWPPTWLT